MIKNLLVFLFVVYSGLGFSLETSKVVDVGGKGITLKSPSGFHISNDSSVLEFWQTALDKFSIRAAIVPNNGGDDSRSMVILTNPSSDKFNLTKDLFIDATRVLIRSQATLIESLKGEIKEFNEIASKKLKEKYGVNYKSSVDDSTKVNVFIDTDSAVSFFSIIEGSFSLASYVDNSPQVASISYLRLKDKLIVLNMYSAYRDIDDIVWIKKKTKEVVALLISANEGTDPVNDSIMESIENGSAEGKYRYGRLALKDFNLRTAQEWIEKAAKNGHTRAQSDVGVMYMVGSGLKLLPIFSADVLGLNDALVGKEKGSKILLDGWLTVATRGEANIGNFKFDLNKGIKYLGLAYEKDDSRAIAACSVVVTNMIGLAKKNSKYNYILGKMYYDGTCTNKDYGKAYPYIKKSSDEGSIYGQHILGKMYFEGYGISKDLDKSIIWLKKSAKGGYARSYLYLSLVHSSKFEENKDFYEWDKAVLYTNKAMEAYNLNPDNNKDKPMFKYLTNRLDKLKTISPYKKDK